MSKVLVVYYSRTGNTRRVAEAVASACHADIEEIRDLRPRQGLFGWIRSLGESARKRPAEIDAVRHDPANYALVLLGTPVWASGMSSPLRRYLHDHRQELPQIAVFATEGGRGGEAAAKQIGDLCGQAPHDVLIVTASDLKSSSWREKVRAFVRDLTAPVLEKPN